VTAKLCILATWRHGLFPDDQHLAVAHVAERSPQARAVGAGAGGTVLEHLGASGSRQSVKLECEVLV